MNNTQTTHSGQVYARDYVIDYTSFERNDLAVFSAGYYSQRNLYTAWGERLEQFTDRDNGATNGGLERLLYVHEDVMGNTMYYSKDNGQSFGELRYDVWGAPTLSGKLLNNDNGNFVAANFTGHTYDTVLDIYFAEARFYDAKYRQWLATDPIKDGLNWYAYCAANPVTYFDPMGLASTTFLNAVYNLLLSGSITKQQAAVIVMAGNAMSFDPLNLALSEIRKGNSVETLDDLLKFDIVSNKQPNANNLYLGFHEATQVLSAYEIALRGGFPIIEMPIFNTKKEIDIVDITGLGIYEVKPIYHNQTAWMSQMMDYIRTLASNGKTFGLGTKRFAGATPILTLSNGATVFLNYLSFGNGEIGYYLLIGCSTKELVSAKNAEVAREWLKKMGQMPVIPGYQEGYAVASQYAAGKALLAARKEALLNNLIEAEKALLASVASVAVLHSVGVYALTSNVALLDATLVNSEAMVRAGSAVDDAIAWAAKKMVVSFELMKDFMGTFTNSGWGYAVG